MASAKRQVTQEDEGSRVSDRVRLPARIIIAALLGLGAAWIAAGSTGLLGHPLRHGLTYLALGAALLVGWPSAQRDVVRRLLLLGAAVVAIPMLASMLTPVNVSGVALLLAALAFAQTRDDARRAIALIAQAVLLLAVFRLACSSIAWFWIAADTVAYDFGSVAGALAGRQLWVGATYGGLDFLVVMLYLAVMAPRQLAAPERRPSYRSIAIKALVAVLAVLLVHLFYLALLAVVGPSTQTEPQAPTTPGFQDLVNPLPAAFSDVAGKWIPWNLPVLAALGHLLLVGLGLFWRWDGAQPDPGEAPVQEGPQKKRTGKKGETKDEPLPAPWRRWLPLLGNAAPVLLAALLPLVATFCPGGGDLTDKKIVLYEKGFLNWLRPEHGQYGRLTVGMYGTMPQYLESLGAKPLISKDLSGEDLKGASALILFFPKDPWEKGQEGQEGQLERIENFVREGGTLAVFGEHTTREKDEEDEQRYGDARFNDLLKSTAMRVRFDSATFAVGGWLQSYDALAHPTTSGIGDMRNEFGSVIGASVRTGWPARPFLVGRYGWADPGDEEDPPAMMGNHIYDGGEKLGDMVLAAEQPLGLGRIIVFGDTSGMTNGLTVGCHRYTSRLLTYLASSSSSPLDAWRQLLALAAAGALAALLLARPKLWSVAAAAIVMPVVLVASTEASYRAWDVPLDGSLITDECSTSKELTASISSAPAKQLAYIDASHGGAYSPESWRDNGVGGLTMTLARDGYLALMLPELSRERLLQPTATADRLWDRDVPADELLRAGVLISIAPGAEYTPSERRLLRDFVRAGGSLICTVGYEDFGPSQSLLAGTDPLPLSPWGGDRPTASGRTLKETDEYRWKHDQILKQLNNPQVADSLATRFAAQFDRIKGTEEYRLRLDKALDEIRQRNFEQLQAAGQATAAAAEPSEEQKAWAKEYATTFASQFAEPYGDQVGFGFYVGALPPPPGQIPTEPLPLGHFKSPYFRGADYETFVRFHSAWPVYCDFTGAVVITEHSPGNSVIMLRRYGRGLVAVVGDTEFAVNKNLEHEGGQPFEGMHENADFWRWFLSMMRGDEPPWTPPRPKNAPKPPVEAQPPADPEPLSPLVLPPDFLPVPGSAPAPAPGASQPQETP